MAPKFVMHIEAKRGWLSGVSTTLCGLTFRVEKSSWFASVICGACIQIEQQNKGKGGKR